MMSGASTNDSAREQDGLLWLSCPSCNHQLPIPEGEACNGLEVRCQNCGASSWLEHVYAEDGSGGHWSLEPDGYWEE